MTELRDRLLMAMSPYVPEQRSLWRRQPDRTGSARQVAVAWPNSNELRTSARRLMQETVLVLFTFAAFAAWREKGLCISQRHKEKQDANPQNEGLALDVSERSKEETRHRPFPFVQDSVRLLMPRTDKILLHLPYVRFPEI